MFTLNQIWVAALLFAGGALFIVLLLVGQRIVDERRIRHRARRSEELKPLLFRALEGNSRVQNPELAALDERDQALVVELCRRLVDSLGGDTRDHLVAIMKSLGHVPSLIHQLSRGYLSQRVQAATDLEWFDSASVRTALRQALEDREYEVRLAAASSLVALGDQDSVDLIIRRLTDSHRVRPLTLRTLARQMAPLALGAFRKLAHSNDDTLVVLAVDALGHFGAPDDIVLLCRLAEFHDSKNVRAAALRTLGLLAAPGAQPAVLKGLRDDSWEVRTQAVICAHRARIMEALPAIRGLVEDKQWWVRFRAVEAQHDLENPDGDSGSHRVTAPWTEAKA